MDLGIKEKVFLVTGGASGIGAAICRTIAVEKGIPVIIDRDDKRGTNLVNELKSSNHEAFFLKTDLIEESQCQSAVNATLKKYSRIDSLINNAGINDGIGLENGDLPGFKGSLEKNLHHYYMMAQFSLPSLKSNKGLIVNIASKVAQTGQGGTSGYAAAKGAILALTREWALELLKYDIRVNAILPGEVMTPMYKQWASSFDNPDEKIKEMASKIPLGNRMTTPEEIASMAVFLASERSSHTTGQLIHVDGGYVHLDRSLIVSK